MIKPTLIGLAGFRGDGKDYTAKVMIELLNLHGIHAVPLAFADPMRDMLKAGFCWSHDQVTDRKRKEAICPKMGVSPRHALQTVGTEWGRNMIGEDVWVRASKTRADKVQECGSVPIFTDVRFNNEASYIRGEGGIIVEINSANTPSDYYARRMQHVSDNRLPDSLIDYRLTNNFMLTYGQTVSQFMTRLYLPEEKAS